MARDEQFDKQAASFDQAADVYEKSRPEYPDAAVDWLVPDGASTVLDLGAGTGKLTRALAARGLEVFAVDPAPNMLEQLRAAVPNASISVGTAEDIPLADASVDAVLVGQAWHWVDQDAALPQVARVLRPGGTLGLIWNVRDESVPWVAKLGVVMHGSEAESFVAGGDIQRGPFGEVESAVFEWSREIDREGLLDLVRSRSYFITATAEEQAAMLSGVDELLDTDPALANADRWVLPYRAHAFRMSLP
jgi:SAM-dependent methyltransferase